MKNIFLYSLLFLIVIMGSCEKPLPGFDFDSFKGTKAEKLATAVSSEDINEIEKIVQEDKSYIDFCEPIFGHSLLMLAVANDLNKSVEKLLELGANPNLRSKPDYSKDIEITTPMFIASDNILNKSNCDIEILKFLVQHGGNVNDTLSVQYVGANYKSTESPLLIAARSKCLEILQFLVESGANINDYNYSEGHGPLSEAIIHKRLENLRYLVVDKKAKIPPYCYVVHEHNESPRKEYTLTDFLLKQNYKEGSTEFKIRQEILNNLKGRNLH